MSQLIVVAAQINFTVGNIEANTELVIQAAHTAYEKHQADLVVFPELALTGYPPEDLLFRPALYRRCQHALDTIAKEVTNTTVIVGCPTQTPNGCFNQAVVIDKGQIILRYSKQELPNYTVFDEKRYFQPGSQAGIFTLKGLKIGILICEDLWFDHAIQQTVDQGAEFIVVLNASPFAEDKAHIRRDLLQHHSKQQQTAILYVNLVGGQDELVFDGGSMCFDAQGSHCAQAAYFSEDLLAVTVDINQPTILNPTAPLPAEMRDEEKVYRALVLGVRDYINKNHFPGAIIGLSGGIDSALTLCVAVDALGAERVNVLMMPSRYSADISLEDATQQAHQLGVNYHIISIEPIFQAFLQSLQPILQGHAVDNTEENLQARCRGTLLMAQSNKTGAIVLTTGNKSEMAVGYSTLYGDMAGGFAVIKDVYKTMVYRLAQYRNSLGQAIPERVLTRAPSAELAEQQLDQDTLPPYPILDDILERYVALDQDFATICAAGFEADVVKDVIRRVNRNEYKRHQSPIGIRITQRAFGKDWRYPITSGFINRRSFEHEQ